MAYYNPNKDWAHSVHVLTQQINAGLSPQDVFSKNKAIVQRALYKKANALIQGCCYYLREQGFAISEHEENKILGNLEITLDYDTTPDGATAYTGRRGNAIVVYVNAGHNLVARYSNGGEMYAAVLGLFYHELGHVLFSSIPTLKAWINSMKRGAWFPKVPVNANTLNGVNLQSSLNVPGFKDAWATIMGNIQNSLEDGYIENELVNMYSGAVKQALAAINVNLLDTLPSVEEILDDPEGSVFDAVHAQVLKYAKFGEMDFGNKCPDEVRYTLEDIALLIDECRVERHPEIRFDLTNQIGIELYPYLEEKIMDMAKKIEQQQNQQNQQGQQGQQGQQSGAGGAGASGGGGGIGSISQDVLNQILQQIAQDAQKTANGAGSSSIADSGLTSEGIANASSNKNKYNKDIQDKAKNAGGVGGQADNASGEGGSGSGGANSGNSTDSPMQRDFENLKNEIADKTAKALTEEERTSQMNEDAQNIPRIEGVNRRITVKRAAEVSDNNVTAYNKNASYFERIAADLSRSMRQILKDRREGGRRKNLVTGRRFEANHYCLHDDFRDFSKIKWPTESPTLSFGVLVDESGSTSGECIEAATKASIVLELFASKEHGLDIKHIISGYTTAYGAGCEIRSYSEPDKIDNNDVYRITGMNSSGGTPTCAAMNYMKERLNELRTDIKIMIVISDGESGDNYRYGDGSTLLRRIIAECHKDRIMVIAAGIGRDRQAVGEEFGADNFLDVSNLEVMPTELADIIKRQLWV